MSMRDVKWTEGAPKMLKAGMVLRSGNDIELMGTEAHGLKLPEGVPFTMADGKPIESHGQVVEGYELAWLGNDGLVPAKVTPCA